MLDNSPLHLRRGGTSLVVELPSRGAPTVRYWGPDLGPLTHDDVTALISTNAPQHRVGDVDEPVAVTLVPLASQGWTGTPGLEGHGRASAFSPAFATVRVEETRRLTDDRTGETGQAGSAHGITLECLDTEAGLRLTIELELTVSGLVRERLTLRNIADNAYLLGSLRATLPLEDRMTEILDLSGRWMRERIPQRHVLTTGRYVRESRKGRPGADASLMLVAGVPGFGFERGEVRAVHVAWSGNHELAVEQTILGGAVLSGAELLLPGEVILEPGDEYRSPWIYAAHGDGLDELAARFHDQVRSQQRARSNPRPVVMNVWEAVYFDHQMDKLIQLADLGAEVGAELFMLDDGWFLGRRDDRRALGDWYIDPDVWPEGFDPIIRHVRSRGMGFGIWVEPEMVSVESRLATEHPEWILRPGERFPPVGKWQHVLDFSNPEVYDYILGRLDWLLGSHDIDYLKWDHNRDVLEPGRDGRAVLREHTLAVYRLIDELRRRHPNVEIENCASGGARIDLEILARTERTWTSDCADPIERAITQQYTNLLMPIEMSGNDIATTHSHTTGRHSTIDLRGGVALLGYLGIQWDLTRATAKERVELAAWITLYKRYRDTLHSGRAVNLDHPDPSLLVRGVVARDGSEAVFTLAQLTSGLAPSSGRVRLPGLDPESTYRVDVVTPDRPLRTRAYTPMPWVAEGTTLPGRVLARYGLEAPVMDPEQVLVIALSRV
ncbi:alpha-galactosidase [Agromyces italicus]|uniref:alpha-galactosidase n=1 Tax=Agromyces italicus TaxID=279572 RepID=UPI0003B66998|nr:alpha-galactosidase [Agromyces italicus]